MKPCMICDQEFPRLKKESVIQLLGLKPPFSIIAPTIQVCANCSKVLKFTNAFLKKIQQGLKTKKIATAIQN